MVFEEVVTVKNECNPWFGNLIISLVTRPIQFDDINLFRLMEQDTIGKSYLTNHDNVIILRKMVGTVPVDVEISLRCQTASMEIFTFLHQPKNPFAMNTIIRRPETISKE